MVDWKLEGGGSYRGVMERNWFTLKYNSCSKINVFTPIYNLKYNSFSNINVFTV